VRPEIAVPASLWAHGMPLRMHSDLLGSSGLGGAASQGEMGTRQVVIREKASCLTVLKKAFISHCGPADLILNEWNQVYDVEDFTWRHSTAKLSPSACCLALTADKCR